MLNYQIAEYGGLECVVASDVEERAPEIVVVLLHGFGATGRDLVPLADELDAALKELSGRIRYVFPAAPIEPPEFQDFGGRAWWPLDMAKLQRAMMLGKFRDLRNESPELMPEARQRLMQLLDELRAETGLPWSKFVLGGFSQGSMLATDVTLRLDESPGGLIVWSGTLLCEEAWRELAAHRKGLQVVQSHGRQDQILPFEAAGWLREMLEQAGANVEFHAFNGPHTIAPIAIEAAARLIERAANVSAEET